MSTYDGITNLPGETVNEVGTDIAMGEGPQVRDVDTLFLKLLQASVVYSRRYDEVNLHPKWADNYRSFKNEHLEHSKYRSDRWRGRTRLVRPKTRSAVRKRMSDAGSAMFSTTDSIIVEAPNKANPMQRAAAGAMKEIINYRTRQNDQKDALPWFLISMGAHQDAQITGRCVSKQFWEFREIEDTEAPKPTPDPITGFTPPPAMRIIANRPMVQLYSPENVAIDPNANWVNPAQDSGFIILKNPMALGEALDMVTGLSHSRLKWKDGAVDLLETYKAQAQPKSATGMAFVRQAREGNAVTAIETMTEGPDNEELRIVWLFENFFRYRGETWHFWSLEDKHILSEVVPVSWIYPEQGGRRPIVIGYGAIESHRLDPMSPVESWMPLQLEINEQVNLRLDSMKQSVSPVTVVRRGRQISSKEIQNRGPDSIIWVQDKEDVTWPVVPGPSSQAYAEMERLNADFDDQAAIFNAGSVQTNRQLNETVGGMNLLNRAVQGQGTFDIHLWIETWVNPVLQQLVSLEKYYEEDQRILQIAGDQAETIKKYRVPVTRELLQMDMLIRADAGLAAADPMERLQKLKAAIEVVGMALGPKAQQNVKMDEIVTEAFGLAGFQDGMRFFEEGEDPVVTELKSALAEAQKEVEDKQGDRIKDLKIKQMEILAGFLTEQMKGVQALKQNAQNAYLAPKVPPGQKPGEGKPGEKAAAQPAPPPKPPSAIAALPNQNAPDPIQAFLMVMKLVAPEIYEQAKLMEEKQQEAQLAAAQQQQQQGPAMLPAPGGAPMMGMV